MGSLSIFLPSMDRLARNLVDLRRMVAELTAKGIRVEFTKEALTFTGQDSPMANLLLSMLGAVAEFERAIILERQKEGIALAKRANVYRGRKQAVTGDKLAELLTRIKAGEKRASLAREFGISRETLYAYTRSAQNPQPNGTGAKSGSGDNLPTQIEA